MSGNFNLELFIKKLFEDLDYESRPFSFVDVEDQVIRESILFNNVFIKNYYLLLFVNNASELKQILGKQASYFFLIKEFFSELREVDKNTSMIIFSRTSEPNNEILLLEEDPYYFKKYVLSYTSEQFNELSESYSNEFKTTGIKKVLDGIVSDVDLFMEFKLNPDDLSVFQFVTNLFIKIPSLSLPTSVDKDIYLLNDSIISTLKEKNLFTIKQQIDLQVPSEVPNDDLNEKIIKSLISFYKEEGE